MFTSIDDYKTIPMICVLCNQPITNSMVFIHITPSLWNSRQQEIIDYVRHRWHVVVYKHVKI